MVGRKAGSDDMNGRRAKERRRVSAKVEAASARDRSYFLAHPGIDRYVRKRMPGEFGPRESDPDFKTATHVEVEQLIPGLRTRMPIQFVDRHAYPSGRIPFEHFEAIVDQYVSNGGQWRFIEDDELDPADVGK